jgi:hypothetical protein
MLNHVTERFVQLLKRDRLCKMCQRLGQRSAIACVKIRKTAHEYGWNPEPVPDLARGIDPVLRTIEPNVHQNKVGPRPLGFRDSALRAAGTPRDAVPQIEEEPLHMRPYQGLVLDNQNPQPARTDSHPNPQCH